MNTYIADIIPKIQRFGFRLDNLKKLTNQHWVSLSDISHDKRVFIFRANKQLLISENGIVQKGSWEYLDKQSLLIETKEGRYLLKRGFFDENILALKLDGDNKYAFFINESRGEEINTIEDILTFLADRYCGSDSCSSQTTNQETIMQDFSNAEKYTEEQERWMSDPNICPACGYNGVLHKRHCPDCGLNLT